MLIYPITSLSPKLSNGHVADVPQEAHRTRYQGPSVAAAQLSNFVTLSNKIVKNLKIFVEIDHLKSQVFCQH